MCPRSQSTDTLLHSYCLALPHHVFLCFGVTLLLPLLPKDYKQSLILLEYEYFFIFWQLICSLWPDVTPAIILRSLYHCMIASSKQTEILFAIKSSCQKQVYKPKCNTEASNRHHKNSEQANSVAKSKYPYLSKTTKKLPKPDLLWTCDIGNEFCWSSSRINWTVLPRGRPKDQRVVQQIEEKSQNL